jgi:SAM-dependent methyltransferase
VRFQVVDARKLVFDNDQFDVAVSALVLDFIPDREKAIAEMRRVVRPGGTVAAYVWDFAGRRGNSAHLNSALAQVTGTDTSAALNAESTTLENLQGLFDANALINTVARPIDIQITYADFDDYWNSNTGFASPVAIAVKSLSEEQQQEIKRLLKAKLPVTDRDTVSYSARVNAVRGCVMT